MKIKSKVTSLIDNLGFSEFVKVSNIFFLILIYTFLFLAICSVILVILLPNIDNLFLQKMLSYILRKYQTIDEDQKNEIRKIFREIFIDTNTSTTTK
jgi:hypothetical protein